MSVEMSREAFVNRLSMREAVEMEFAAYAMEHPEDTLSGFLGNFYMNLPVSNAFSRRGCRSMRTIISAERSKRPFGINTQWSELMQSKTPEEYFADIDDAFDTRRINVRQAKRLMTSVCTAGDKTFRKQLFKLNQIAFEVYIGMRERGYTHNDLTV